MSNLNSNFVKSLCHFTVVFSFHLNKITLQLNKNMTQLMMISDEAVTFTHSQPAAEAKRFPENSRSFAFLSRMRAATSSSVPGRLKQINDLLPCLSDTCVISLTLLIN